MATSKKAAVKKTAPKKAAPKKAVPQKETAISAKKKVPKFRPGKALKDAVN